MKKIITTLVLGWCCSQAFASGKTPGMYSTTKFPSNTDVGQLDFMSHPTLIRVLTHAYSGRIKSRVLKDIQACKAP